MVSLKNHLDEETAQKATVLLASLSIYRHECMNSSSIYVVTISR